MTSEDIKKNLYDAIYKGKKLNLYENDDQREIIETLFRNLQPKSRKEKK